MIQSEADLLRFLDAGHIPYQYIQHPAVFTCDEAEKFRPKLTAVSTKNLFLSDRTGHHYLVMTDCEKRLDLKSLGASIGATKLHFGSEDDLAEFLGVTRGAVSVLGLVNDSTIRVELLVDEEIWDGEFFLCHPLVNTATLVISKTDLEKFFQLARHQIQVVKMP